MQKSLQDIIQEILTIIDYRDNKADYANEFLLNCEKQALLDLLTALPQEKQGQFKQQITATTDQEQIRAVVIQYATPEQYQDALQKATATALKGFIEEVTPSLSGELANKLQSYLQLLTSSNALIYS